MSGVIFLGGTLTVGEVFDGDCWRRSHPTDADKSAIFLSADVLAISAYRLEVEPVRAVGQSRRAGC